MRICLSAVAVVILVLPALAASDDARCLSRVGEWPRASSLAVAGSPDRVVFSRGRELVVVSTATSPPQVVGSLALPAPVTGIALSGDLAIVAASTAGLVVVDLSDPGSPQETGAVAGGWSALDVALIGGYAYVAAGDDGLRVVDLSDPTHPVEVMSTPRFAVDVAVAGSVACVFGGGLDVFDAGDPSFPLHVGNLALPGSEQVGGLAMDGTRAYIAQRETARLDVVDVSDPTQPSLVATSGPTFADRQLFDLVVEGSTAWLTRGVDGVVKLDVSDPAAPTILAELDTPGAAVAIAAAGATAYVADSSAGLRVLDLPSGGIATEIHAIDDTPGAVDAVTFADGFAYLVSANGIEVLDVADPAEPVLAGSWQRPQPMRFGTNAVEVADGYAYVASASGVLVVDVRQLAGIGEVAQIGSVRGSDISVDGPMLVAAGGRVEIDPDRILAVVDIGDPANSAVAWSWQPLSHSIDVAARLQGTLMLSLRSSYGWGGLVIDDVTIPSAPALLSSTPLSSAHRAIDVDSTYAYVFDPEAEELEVIDFADPVAPTVVGSSPVPGGRLGRDLEADGPNLVVSGGSRILLFDVSRPTTPTLLSSQRAEIPAGWLGGDVAISGALVAVTLADMGLGLYEIGSCELFADGFESGDLGAWSAAPPP